MQYTKKKKKEIRNLFLIQKYSIFCAAPIIAFSSFAKTNQPSSGPTSKPRFRLLFWLPSLSLFTFSSDVVLICKVHCKEKSDEHNLYIWVIGQAWGQDGGILARFFSCVFMHRDEVEVHKHAKKRTRPISRHLDRTSLVNKGFIIWLEGRGKIVFLREQSRQSRAVEMAPSWPRG